MEPGRALREATSNGRIADVERLLGLDSRLAGDPGEHGLAALHLAAKSESTQLLRLILELKAQDVDVNQQDNYGRSALHYASSYGRAESAAALLRAGANVNLQTSIYWTPLHFAALFNHISLVEQLLDAKASICLGDNLGWLALHIASREGHDQVIAKLLYAGADVNAAENRHWTPLHMAAQSNRASAVSLLIQAGADVNSQETRGFSPLHIAAQRGFDQIARLLLSAGAKVDLLTHIGRSALFYATQNCQSRVVAMLLEAGADVALTTPAGICPLTLACFQGNRDIALQLIRSLSDRGISIQAALPPDCASYAASLAVRNPKLISRCQAITGGDLHSALISAGFTLERSATVASAADTLQAIIRKISHNEDGSHVVGSYADGWGSSLECLDGHIDAESDVDITTFSPVSRQLHLQGGRCQCDDPNPEFIVQYENGHVKRAGHPSSPSHAFNGSYLKPAMDNVMATPVCCYPPIDVLENPERLERTHLAPSILDSLIKELRRSNCHAVEAAPPGSEGKYLRISTTFMERIVMRGLTDVQGHLFIALKYLVKSVISSRVRGLKTYHVKTLLFYLLDKTPADCWRPQNFLDLIKQVLDFLISTLEITGPGECMHHFFMSDAILYLRRDHASKEEIFAALQLTLRDLDSELSVFLSHLRPPQDLGCVYFQPFLMMPHTVLPSAAAQSGPLPFPDIYTAVKDSLVQLSSADCAQAVLPVTLDQIPDCALTARESLRILTRLRENAADPAAGMKRITDLPRPVHLAVPATGSEAVWHHLRANYSTWKFCFEFNPVPKLNFLPEHLREAFPCQTPNYNDYRYVNFDALYACLCLELEVLAPEEAATWFEEVITNRYADVQELFVALNYCRDIPMLVRLIHAHGQLMAVHPLTCDKLDKLMEASPELIHRSCTRTLQVVTEANDSGCV